MYELDFIDEYIISFFPVPDSLLYIGVQFKRIAVFRVIEFIERQSDNLVFTCAVFQEIFPEKGKKKI